VGKVRDALKTIENGRRLPAGAVVVALMMAAAGIGAKILMDRSSRR